MYIFSFKRVLNSSAKREDPDKPISVTQGDTISWFNRLIKVKVKNE